MAKVEADAETAAALDIAPGALVYEQARLVKDGDTPTHTLTSYYNPTYVEGTPLVDPKPGPATPGGEFAVLIPYVLEPDRVAGSVCARMPTPEEVDTLAFPVGEPVMILKRRTFTEDGLSVEFARGVHAASRFEWSYSFPLPDQPSRKAGHQCLPL